MRRFLIFGLLGPPLGFVVAFFGLLPLIGSEPRFDPHGIVLLPLAYFLGLVPALIAAGFDHWLAKDGVRYRPIWIAAIGFGVSFLPVARAFLVTPSPYFLIYGVIGAVPGFICSWLAGRFARPVAASNPVSGA